MQKQKILIVDDDGQGAAVGQALEYPRQDAGDIAFMPPGRDIAVCPPELHPAPHLFGVDRHTGRKAVDRDADTSAVGFAEERKAYIASVCKGHMFLCSSKSRC